MKSFLGNFYRHLAIFIWSHWLRTSPFRCCCSCTETYRSNSQSQPAYFVFKWCQSDVDHQSCLVIIGLTSDARESWWTITDDKREYIHSVYTDAYHQWDAKWNHIRKWMTLHSENEKLWQTRYWTALQLFDSFCKINNISLLQVNIFCPTKIFNVNSLHDSTSCMLNLLQSIQRKSNINLIAPCGHPNEQGAKKLADYYTSVIKSKNLI